MRDTGKKRKGAGLSARPLNRLSGYKPIAYFTKGAGIG
jgi:hypothetical protein